MPLLAAVMLSYLSFEKKKNKNRNVKDCIVLIYYLIFFFFFDNVLLSVCLENIYIIGHYNPSVKTMA